MSIRSFRDQATLDIYQGANTKRARRALPVELHEKAWRMLDRIEKAETIGEIEATPGYRLKPLAGDREGQISVRINEQYRICFYWRNAGAHAVEITDYHD